MLSSLIKDKSYYYYHNYSFNLSSANVFIFRKTFFVKQIYNKFTDADVTQNVDLFTDKEIYKRQEHGTADRSVVANVTDMRFMVSGNVTSWTYFSNYGGDIAFQVWRFYEAESK